MSDALNYLVAARGDALGHYFKFLKDAGKHLDPKTRDLISVITKVHSQTEGGFRQYLTRALRDGVKPIEIIDALVMAFPALGLAKIVWAAEIILEMDMPEFRPENLTKEAAWHDVGAVDSFKDGDTARVPCDTRELFVYRKGDDFKVYDSRCPHQVTNIPHLALSGTELTCPKHHWKFDITTGQCTAVGNQPLKKFDCKIENGRLLAFW
jgi:nitrite reductase/ring-hydroxylating ferredoxin subunit/alkylhydroperoxidase/carboxymuconolactone decarboxylase family protein YurZ